MANGAATLAAKGTAPALATLLPTVADHPHPDSHRTLPCASTVNPFRPGVCGRAPSWRTSQGVRPKRSTAASGPPTPASPPPLWYGAPQLLGTGNILEVVKVMPFLKKIFLNEHKNYLPHFDFRSRSSFCDFPPVGIFLWLQRMYQAVPKIQFAEPDFFLKISDFSLCMACIIEVFPDTEKPV